MTVIAIVLVLPFVLPDVALAADPTVTRYDQTDEHIDYTGTWDTFEKTAAYETAYARANTRGASVTIYFSGTRLDWIAMKGTSTGKADVYLDDVFQKTVDLAASLRGLPGRGVVHRRSPVRPAQSDRSPGLQAPLRARS